LRNFSVPLPALYGAQGIVDAHLQQEVDAPAFYANIDRTRAAQLGLNANSIATNVNVSLGIARSRPRCAPSSI
jgi:multidrug efflux pump subunit AcrB